ncbi:hypothetical protein [Nocardioides massiliensis]|nr:hypothetical protein [Nocardioides massiliensis]
MLTTDDHRGIDMFVRKLLGTVLGGAFIAAAGVVVTAAPAQADTLGSGAGAECSGSGCSVTVRYSGSAAPAPGSPRHVASVPPTCWYGDPLTPQQLLQKWDDATADGHYSGIDHLRLYGSRAEIEEVANNEDLQDARWYQLRCRTGIGLDDPEAIDYAGESVNMAPGGDHPYARITRLIRPGESAPAPLVDVETLRDAAYDSMTIPDPDLERNPTVSAAAATLVNLDTFFWADDYQDTWDITASVGPISATVIARGNRWILSSPAGGATCDFAQLTRAWSAGTSPEEGCTITFGRSSRGYANGFPVDVNASWETSWTGVPGPSAPTPLDPLSTSSTDFVPVMESQALVTTVG